MEGRQSQEGYLDNTKSHSWVDGGKNYNSLITSVTAVNNLLHIKLTASGKWYIGTYSSQNNYPAIAEINGIQVRFD